MRYELLLQTMTPGTAYDAARVDALLAERSVVLRPDGQRVWRLPDGDVEVGVLREAGQVVATELRVPLSERSELMRATVVEAAALAAAAGARLFDPQLGRALEAQDAGPVVEQYTRTARYAGEVAGLPEAIGASYAMPEPQGFSPGTRFLLFAMGAFVVLYFVVGALIDRLNGR
ncbi:hypothetical protein JGU66_28745 [Myxococcaceae bacterium JPH2]|nr:hypothetical protein [Myxococcaceae bacterium JPH2]